MSRVVVLGGGIGGVESAKTLIRSSIRPVY
jgi:NADH dehydrogenase FAD-containing subunit